MPVYLSPPPSNPLARLLAVIIAALAVIGGFMLGLVALAVIAGVGLVVGIAVWIQAWRIKRQLQRGEATVTRRAEGETIEAEYTVISRQSDDS